LGKPQAVGKKRSKEITEKNLGKRRTEKKGIKRGKPWEKKKNR